jgi:hypothetical protein
LKQLVQPSPRAPIESLLAALYQREQDLEGQLRELEQDIEALSALNQPIGQRRLAQHDKLREAYWTAKRRFAQLKTQRPDWLPPGVSTPGDF